MYNVDVAQHSVKVAEGALLPTVNVQGSISKNWGSQQSLSVLENYGYGVIGQLSVPIYQGGAEYAAVRQAKETLGQRRLDLDTAREQAQATVVAGLGRPRDGPRADRIHPGPGAGGRRSPSTACARKPGSASAPPSTC